MSNITRFAIYHQVAPTATEDNKAQPPPPIENDLVLMTFLSAPMQRDLDPPIIEWAVFQALLFFQPMQ